MILDDDMIAQITATIQGALTIVDEQIGYDAKDVLLRRLRDNYDKLSLEQIMAVMQTMGHKPNEANPCPVCKLIAHKEYDLSEGY